MEQHLAGLRRITAVVLSVVSAVAVLTGADVSQDQIAAFGESLNDLVAAGAAVAAGAVALYSKLRPDEKIRGEVAHDAKG